MEPSDREVRSLALHLLAVQKIRRQPELFNRLQETLDHWRLLGSDTQPLLAEWQRLVDEGMAATLAAATDPSETGRALRRASPFVCILTDEERAAVLSRCSRLRKESTAGR
jgi:hypothetical protein